MFISIAYFLLGASENLGFGIKNLVVEFTYKIK